MAVKNITDLHVLGNVGIGTTSPAYPLEVQSGGAGTVLRAGTSFLSIDSAGSAASPSLVFNGDTNTGLYRPAADTLAAVTNGSERMRIDSSGNVSIGTTSALVTSSNRGNLTINGSVDSILTLGVNHSWKTYLYSNSAATYLSSQGARFTAFETNSSERMRITADGNVGIGETSIDAKLHLTAQSAGLINQKFESAGSAAWRLGIPAGQTYFAFDNANDNLSSPDVVIDSSGNVGIGTTSPAEELHVVGDTRTSRLIITDTGGVGRLTLDIDANEDTVLTTGTTTGTRSLLFLTETAERMRIDSSGNVGIGTTSPNEKLHVNGTVRFVNSGFAGFEAHNTNGTWESFIGTETGGGGNRYNSASSQHTFYNNSSAVMRINSNGDVGIGTTSPSAKLDIYGDSNSADNMIELINSKYDSTNTTGETGILFGWNNHVAARITAFKEGTTNRTGFKIVGEAGFNVPTTIATFRSTGNVGIGTTSPSSTLTVNGRIEVLKDDISSTSEGGHITLRAASNYNYRFSIDNYQDNFRVVKEDDSSSSNGTVPLLITAAGNVGIGTTSPDRNLHIYQGNSGVTGYSLTGGIDIESTSVTGINILSPNNGYGRIYFGSPSGSTAGALEYIHSSTLSSGYMKFRAGGADHMFILGNGNVGIGTTSPSEKLHVVGRVHIGDVNYSYGGSNYHIKLAENSNDAYISNIEGYGILSAGGYYHGANLRMLNSTSTAYSGIQMRPDGTMHFESATGGTAGTTIGASTKMYISGAGNVGIGTTSPTARLNVSGVSVGAAIDWSNTTATTGRNFRWVSLNGGGFAVEDLTASGANRLLIASSGNIGIGTTSPDSFLQVKTHTHYDYVHDLHQKIATFNPSGMSGAGSSAAVNIGNGSYGTSGTENLYLQFLNTHGNYGYPVGWRIKSYTDLNTAGANSSFAIQQVRRGNSTSPNGGTQPYIDTDFLINQDGNVGIGTTSPSYKLEVDGSFSGGGIVADAGPGTFTFNGDNVLYGNIPSGVVPMGATLGLSATGLEDNLAGLSGYSGAYGSGISYRDPIAPYGPSGSPDWGSSAAFGGFFSNGSFISQVPGSDAAYYSSSMGIGDVATFDGPATFDYGYGSNSIRVNPAILVFTVFDFLGGGSELRFDPFGAGTLFAPSFTPTSDKRLKENIIKVSSGLDVVTKLQGVEYDWKSNGKKSSGFIAQEVQEVVPHAVVENDGTLALNYNAIMAYQNEAIKELKGIIDELKQEIEILKNK